VCPPTGPVTVHPSRERRPVHGDPGDRRAQAHPHVVAIDAVGRELGSLTTQATSSEDHLGCYVGRGASVTSGHGRWRTAGTCPGASRAACWRRASGSCGCRPGSWPMPRTARTYGKSDPIDALAGRTGGAASPGPAHGAVGWAEPGAAPAGRSPRGSGGRTHSGHYRLRWHLHEFDPSWDPSVAR
jgi:transposase